MGGILIFLRWANGIEYKGSFNDNCLEGEGILSSNDGEKYEVEVEKKN